MTVYRNRSFSLLVIFIAVVFAVASMVSALLGGEGATAERWAPVAAVVALSAFCLLRLARAGVYADDAGIRVLNPLRTSSVPWEEVMRFTLRPDRGFAAVGFAELRDGSRLRIWALQARTASPASRRIPEGIVEQLNERLARERAKMQA